MRRPVVGVTCYVEQARWGEWNLPAALLPLSYVKAIERAGGRPVLVPPMTEAVDETVEALDGIVFAGGADLSPQLYGANPHPETKIVRPDRDRGEIALMESATSRGVPTLAVCRGMQLLNIVRGGDLIQHLPDLSDETHTAPGDFPRHDVQIAPESLLAEMLGERANVPSHHHQAPGRLGASLRAVATAPDGTIEAIEDPSATFLVGVLWHPEETEDGSLFEHLVEEAARQRKVPERS